MKARLIALYLPQYHPTPENDFFWGKGFTEWRNVAKAKPLFKNHYQPRIPADLGFYDLRVPEIREKQADMAKKYGIEGFCYWHYWFGNGKKILEKPLEIVRDSHKPDFPFCIGWANHSWSNKTWEKTGRFKKETILLKQTYPGEHDIIEHFYYLLPFFKDKRYIKVDGNPLFMIFNPFEIPDNRILINTWTKLAIENGLKGIHFVARIETAESNFTKGMVLSGDLTHKRFNKCLDWGYNSIYSVPVQAIKIIFTSTNKRIYNKILRKLGIDKGLEKYDYKKIIDYMYCQEDYKENVYPQIMPHWDNTPRQGKSGYIYTGESPELFGKQIDKAFNCVKHKQKEHRIIFVHSWNEWGEGAYLEPDLRYGTKYLEQIRERIQE